MSAMPIALLLTTAATGAVGVAVLRTVLKLRRQLSELQRQLAENEAATTRALLPSARSHADAEQIRVAVAEALAEERERELAEARAFWAAQEARDASDMPSLLGLSDSDLFLPRQADFTGLEPVSEPAADADEFSPKDFVQGGTSAESPELAAARRRHPSHPDFVPVQSPIVNDHERTVSTLEQLAAERTELCDVRPGPLGTLDVYVFTDGTTLCMTPGHRETAEHLAAALRSGESPYLLGGSGVSGAYTLTFACGKDGKDTVYVLADRVIASL
ncbi:LapA family protein [Streptomyces sp. NK08204]|uniref:LapA family protein n=1 Tax=Streptomyces sp. NK08204 TaxID=2873260 RepID=UPI001CED84B7|nr:LapA family protein [Streptomyces sp. NK08204]